MENGSRPMRIDRDFVLTHDSREVLHPVYWSVDLSGPRKYEASLKPFTLSQRRALAVFWYQAEVRNGGHGQFFCNPTGVVWKDALAGLDMIGLWAFAAVLREAVDRLGGNPPLSRKAREPLLEAPGSGCHDLDERFYALEKQQNVLVALTDWMHGHPDDFTFDGSVARP